MTFTVEYVCDIIISENEVLAAPALDVISTLKSQQSDAAASSKEGRVVLDGSDDLVQKSIVGIGLAEKVG